MVAQGHRAADVATGVAGWSRCTGVNRGTSRSTSRHRSTIIALVAEPAETSEPTMTVTTGVACGASRSAAEAAKELRGGFGSGGHGRHENQTIHGNLSAAPRQTLRDCNHPMPLVYITIPNRIRSEAVARSVVK